MAYTFIKVPRTKEEITVPWLSIIFSPFGYKVQSYSWEGAANNGLGLMSTLGRMTLQLQNHNSSGSQRLSVVFKLLPTGPPLRDITVHGGFASRELKMYTELFPSWERFLEERNVPQEFRFRYPKCYYGASEGEGDDYEQILILEDLFSSGFHMWPEGYGKSLSWTESKPCIRLIALFHAVGLAYKVANGIQTYKTALPFLDHHIEATETMLGHFFNNGFNVIDKLLKYYSTGNEAHTEDKSLIELLPIPVGMLEHLQVLRDNAYYNLRFLEPEEGQLGTVCHHDFHVNNFMFPSEEDGDVVVFDFQACIHSKPTKDLSFFLIQNCETSLLSTHFYKVVEYYHQILHQALKAMKVELNYTLDNIIQEYRETAYLSVLHLIASAAQMYTTEGGATVDAKRRFYNNLVHMYRDGLLKCSIKPT